MLKLFRNKKISAIVIALSLLMLMTAVGGTVAYIVERSTTSDNTFEPVMVDTEPVNSQNGIAVKNCGDVSAYIRAAAVVNWVKLDGEGNPTGTYHSNAPKENIDYTISFDESENWFLGSDGFWYYKTPVEAGASTPALITEIARVTAAPSGYKLSLELVTNGIQSTPIKAVEDAWGVTVSGNSIEK